MQRPEGDIRCSVNCPSLYSMETGSPLNLDADLRDIPSDPPYLHHRQCWGYRQALSHAQCFMWVLGPELCHKFSPTEPSLQTLPTDFSKLLGPCLSLRSAT